MKRTEIPTFQPRLRVLNREQALAIHAAALEILAKTGFKMEHPGALELLAGAGAKVSNGDWVKLPTHIVEEALKSALLDLFQENTGMFLSFYLLIPTVWIFSVVDAYLTVQRKRRRYASSNKPLIG